MRVHPHFRIRAHIQDLIRKVRRFAVTALVLVGLFTGVVVGKNVFLGRLKGELQKVFAYGELRASYFPPALILDDVRSLSGPPLFRAKRVRIELPFGSLLRNEKTVTVILESPQIRVRPEPAKPGEKKRSLPASLPFTVARGIIQDGSFSYESESAFFEACGLKLLFTRGGDEFALKATSDKSTFTSLADKLQLGGRLNLSVAGKGREVRIQRLTVEGPDVTLKAGGRLENLRDPEFDLDTRFEVEMGTAAPLLNLPFQWKGKVVGRGKLARKARRVSLGTDIGGDGIAIAGVPLGRLRGRIDIEFGKGGTVDIDMKKPDRPAEAVLITFGGGRVEGRVKDAVMDPIMSEVGIAWPVRSPASGVFTLKKGVLRVDAGFSDRTLERQGGRFSFRGDLEVGVNFKTKDVAITTRDLQCGFARVEARSAMRIGGNMNVEIRGTVADVKQAREFVSLILNQPFVFPEIRGAGYADVRVTGDWLNPRVSIKGPFQPAGFDLFNAAFVDADAVILGRNFHGTFRAEDTDVKADIEVSAGPDKTEVDIRNAEGDVAKTFAALLIPLTFQGRAAGDFHVVETLTSVQVTGTFTSPDLRGYGLTCGNVSGRLDWKDGTLSLSEIGLDLYGGRLQGRVLLGVENRAFDVDLRAEGIDVSKLNPGSGAAGILSIGAAGRGVFGKDRLTGRFTVRDFVLSPILKTEARGDFSLDCTRDNIALDVKAACLPGDNEVQALVSIPLGVDSLGGSLKGRWTNLDLLIPWSGAKGRLDFTAEVSGAKSSPHVSGRINFRGPVMPLPRFAHAVTDYSGVLDIEDGRITASDVKGKLGGGDVKASGEIGLGPTGVETIDVSMSGKDMLLSPLERTRILVDGTVRLIKDSRQFVLDGDLLIRQLIWRREIYERFGFSSQTRYAADRKPGFFDNLSLNLRLRATDNALMDNSLGRISGRFDLSITGAVDDPVLLGDIDVVKGNVNFQDQKFRVITGRLSFFNPGGVDPYLDLKAETYVKDYRVTMSLSGPASRLKPEFASSPPMPAEDVLALLAMGESFKRTYSVDPERSTTLSTASLLSFQIADQAKKRAEGLFTLDRFRIDPFVTGTSAEMTARLTLGKKLSRNVLFMYATNLATQREEIYRMEWEMGSDFSLVGIRNEYQRVSFDLKFRKRF